MVSILWDFVFGWRSAFRVMFLAAIAPVAAFVLGFIAIGVLISSIIFDRFKQHFEITMTREMLPPKAEESTLTTPDGVTLRYYTGTSTSGKTPDGSTPSADKVVLFFNPLGMKGPKSYAPVIAACVEAWGPGVTFIGFDYRGFFESDDPKRMRTIDVRNHAQDGYEVLKAVVGETRGADLVVGHSMGVQVSLEFALLYPEKVGSMVLLNGTYGHALQTGLQPIIKLPYVGDLLCGLILWIVERGHEQYLEAMRKGGEPIVGVIFAALTRCFGSKSMEKLMGKDYMLQFWNNYLGGVCSNTKSMKAFLRGFQVLDAHNTSHLLFQLSHPTLLIAGLWDIFTPAYNMCVMNRQMQNTRLVIDIFSTHATVIEHPERVLGEVTHFLSKEVPNFKRMKSMVFEKQE